MRFIKSFKSSSLLVYSEELAQPVEIRHPGDKFRFRGGKVIELLAVVLQLFPFSFKRALRVLLLALGRLLSGPGRFLRLALDPQPVLLLLPPSLSWIEAAKRVGRIGTR